MKKQSDLQKYTKLLKNIKELETAIADESLPVGYDTRLKSAELEAVRTIRILLKDVINTLKGEI